MTGTAGTTQALAIREARALALRAQGIGRWPNRPRRAALRALLQRLGAIQLDSVNAVARSHELVPFSRLGPYQVAELYQVVYRERRAFEYWAHAMSWVPIEELRYFLLRMERFRAQPRGWWGDVRARFPALYPLVLERIRAEGPLAASDFEDTRASRGAWWDLKPAKLVLEDLFDQGVLMVADRRAGFQRVYDLAERVLPAGLDLRRPSDEEAARYLLLRAARALGIGTARDLADYFRLSPQERRLGLTALLEDGCLERVAVEGWREPAYVPADALHQPLRRPRHRPVLLSPFDPLVWERSRAVRFFDFDYRLEIYTPQARRRYGYYVLPLLADGALIGRVDARHERAARLLRAPAVHLEPGVDDTAAPAFASALRDLAAFLGAERIILERAEPAWLLAPLRRLLMDRDAGVPEAVDMVGLEPEAERTRAAP